MNYIPSISYSIESFPLWLLLLISASDILSMEILFNNILISVCYCISEVG